MHVLNVVGDAGHESVNRIARKKFNGQSLNMAIKLHAKIVHDHMTAIFHDYFLEKIEQKSMMMIAKKISEIKVRPATSGRRNMARSFLSSNESLSNDILATLPSTINHLRYLSTIF